MKKSIERLLKKSLYEQGVDEPEEEEETPKKPGEEEEEVEKKDIEDIEKDDLEDDEEDDLEREEDVAVSVNLNKVPEKGGQIKLITWPKLDSLNSIESILKLFNLSSEQLQRGFENRVVITIKSPLNDFKDEEYKITLMDKIGEISINRPDFTDTIVKKSAGAGMNMQQAIGAGEAPAAGEQLPAQQVDLSYLPELDAVFLKTIKGQFFDRLLDKRG